MVYLDNAATMNGNRLFIRLYLMTIMFSTMVMRVLVLLLGIIIVFLFGWKVRW